VKILNLFRVLLLVILVLTVLDSRASEPINEVLSLSSLSASDGNEVDKDEGPLSIPIVTMVLFNFNYVLIDNIKDAFTSFYTNPQLARDLRPPSA
jgi:hypothetical protein